MHPGETHDTEAAGLVARATHHGRLRGLRYQDRTLPCRTRRGRRPGPRRAAATLIAECCHAHDWDDPGKPPIAWTTRPPGTRWVSALVTDATLIEDRIISTVDPRARHVHKTVHHRQDGYKAHVAVGPEHRDIHRRTADSGRRQGQSRGGHRASAAGRRTRSARPGRGARRYCLRHRRHPRPLAAARHVAVIKPPPPRRTIPVGFTLDDFTMD
jgi:hypothetical protein